jgi:Flp pilus assembly CpaE family ATPase
VPRSELSSKSPSSTLTYPAKTVYPFKIVLAGVSEPIVQHLKSEIAAQGAFIEGEFANAASAADRFADEKPSARLLIVQDTSGRIAESVHLLRDRYSSWPILALVETTGESAALLAANRAGADQVVALPLNDTDFGEALGRLALRFRPPDRPSLVIAVSGLVPGAGATTLATSLAAELAAGHAVQTLLIEAALRMGVLAMNLNVRASTHLAELMADGDKLDGIQFRKALVSIAPRFDLLPAAPDLIRTIPNPVQALLRVIGCARQAATAVVVDLPCTYDDVHFETLWTADQMLLVGNQSLPSVRNAKMILDAAAHAKTVKRVHIVLNKYDPAITGLTSEKIAETLGGCEVLTVPNDYVGGV